MRKEFLDLRRQPIANKFLKEDEFKDEFFFDLKVVFDEDTKLVSLKEFVKPELMFNEDYDYAFLGAWNFKDVIANKEREFVENGGKFITHVPEVMVFS
jgi:hypothetical protein